MVDSPNMLEYEDVLVLGELEMGFKNHGQILCVKELHDDCHCPVCRPEKRKHWRISYCKYGFKPTLWMDEEPKGCVFLNQPDDKYCTIYCTHYDKDIKAQAKEEIYGK